jgi:hypothetical protein
MKLKIKAVILLVAMLLTFVGFNAMVTSSSVDQMLKMGKRAGYEIISNVVARMDSNHPKG